MTRDELYQRVQNDFTYHPPTPEQQIFYENCRENYRFLAEWLITNCPTSRELSLALTKLEEAMFWSNASIARNE